MEHQQVSALILLDISTTFDTVDHSILIEVLSNKFDVTGTALQWFKDYLTNRKFKVCINNYSDKKYLSFSVPQGSINGPVLFTSYSSTIRDVIDTEITVNAFAAYHSLQKCFKPINDNESKTTELLESNLKKAGEWMCQNQIIKIKIIYFLYCPLKPDIIIFSVLNSIYTYNKIFNNYVYVIQYLQYKNWMYILKLKVSKTRIRGLSQNVI